MAGSPCLVWHNDKNQKSKETDFIQVITDGRTLQMLRKECLAGWFWGVDNFQMECFESDESEVAQSCPTLCEPMDYSLPDSSVHGILRQEYWSGFPFPSPGDLPDPGIEPGSPALQADSLPTELWEKPA